MRTVTLEEFKKAVRYHLNEEIDNESLGLRIGEESDKDDTDIDAVIVSHIVEAIDYIHSVAAVETLDGLDAESGTDYDCEAVDGTVLDIRFKDTVSVLRIVSFRAADTPFNVREVVPEGGPQGHMMLNPYTRGTWDRPWIVQQADTQDHHPHLRYYSLREEPAEGTDPVAEFIYVPKQFLADDTESFLVSSALYENTVNYLTGLVLNTYGEYERAQIYFGRAETK